MTVLRKPCPHCGAPLTVYANPTPTVDVIITTNEGVILIRRKNPPQGWALPGGFVDYGESVERAAVREAKEETGLDIELTGLQGVYSDPARDPRQHTISTVFTARTKNLAALRAGDDAETVGAFAGNALPSPLVFDHERILNDFFCRRSSLDCACPADPLHPPSS